MELKAYREQIDYIDDEIVRLFRQRMDVAAQIAQYKQEKGLPILQPEREQEKLDTLCRAVEPTLRPDLRELYGLLFTLSRRHQAAVLHREEP